LNDNPKVAIGFSGGVDSAYLLYMCKRYGADIMAYYIKSLFQPEFELVIAKKFTKLIGVRLKVIEIDILSNEKIVSNPEDRCYFCKKIIFGAIKQHAKEDGYSLVIDGSNVSDSPSNRPGMKALDELGVRSPLRECGMTKEMIRALSKEAGLYLWNRTAYACLSTRIPTGTFITENLLKRIECAEDALFSMGFSDFRVRVLNDVARLQVPNDQMHIALERREHILDVVKPFFPAVLLDFEGR